MRLAACFVLLAASLLPRPGEGAPVSFVAFGDMPYCNDRDPEGCRAELGRVEALIGAINAARPAFSIFLGDTKAAGERCTDAVVLDRTAAWFARVEGPLVYTPGDNEWTDCWQDRAGRFDPLERLARLRELLPWASDRLRPGWRVRSIGLASVLGAAAAAGFAALPAGAPGPLVAAVLLAVGLFGVGWYPLFVLQVAEMAPKGSVASTVALAMALGQVGMALAPFLFGLVVDHMGYGPAWALLLAPVAATALPLLRARRRAVV